MDNFHDVYVQHALKKWVSRCRPSTSLRSRLLHRLAFDTLRDQSGILQAYILSSNQILTWSFVYTFQGVARSDMALTGVRVVF